MAVVILAPARDWTDNQATASLNRKHPIQATVPLWSSTTGINARGSLDVRELGGRVDWITDFLNTTRNDASEANASSIVTGIRCPAPLGIVTYEDILDTLLQKTSRDEKDFFERKTFDPPTKKRKEGDDNTVKSSRSIFSSRRAIPTHVSRVHVAFGGNSTSQGTLRRRNLSKNPGETDDTRDVGVCGLDGNDDHSVSGHGALTADHSSYTENSDGGFHGPSSSADTELSTLAQRNISVNHKLRRLKGRSVTSSRTVSSPEKNTESAFQLGLDLIPRHSSCGFLPFVGGLYDTMSYSGEIPSLDGVSTGSKDVFHAEKIIHETVISGCDSPASVSSSYSSHSDADYSRQTNETATHIVNENAPVGDKMHTVPRVKYQNQLAIGNFMSHEMHSREESFHDDRSLLPSQWKGNESDSKQNSARRISFWV
jgi:hypothetical protein